MKKILILGAGASRGNGANQSKPPLASSFFTIDESEKLKSVYEPLFEFLKTYSQDKTFLDTKVDIEELYGQIESIWHLCKFNWEERLERYGKPFALVTPPQMLRSYITDLVYECTKWLQHSTCPYHDLLCTKYLQKDDVIISFNYDLMIDISLKRNRKWFEYNGYGFLEQTLIENIENVEKSEIFLFKPHGSINWFRSKFLRPIISSEVDKDRKLEWEDRIRVIWIEDGMYGKNYHSDKEESILRTAIQSSEFYDQVLPEDKTDPNERFLKMSLLAGINEKEYFAFSNGHIPMLIMPNKYKSFNELIYGELQSIWRKIFESLEKADEILAIGFSFRDLHFNQLLFEAIRHRGNKPKMTIVTTDKQSYDFIEKNIGWIPIKPVPYYGGFVEYVKNL